MPLTPTKLIKGQKKLILEHLRTRGSITAVEALISYHCFRLAARINELRNHGHSIETVMKLDPQGARYARYHMEA